jgi:hypothetical protein
MWGPKASLSLSLSLSLYIYIYIYIIGTVKKLRIEVSSKYFRGSKDYFKVQCKFHCILQSSRCLQLTSYRIFVDLTSIFLTVTSTVCVHQSTFIWMYVGQSVSLRDLHKMPSLQQQQQTPRENPHHTYATMCVR